MRKSRAKGKLPVLVHKAERALKKAVREAIKDHARTGDPVVIWRKGKVVWVPAEQLLKKRR